MDEWNGTNTLKIYCKGIPRRELRGGHSKFYLLNGVPPRIDTTEHSSNSHSMDAWLIKLMAIQTARASRADSHNSAPTKGLKTVVLNIGDATLVSNGKHAIILSNGERFYDDSTVLAVSSEHIIQDMCSPLSMDVSVVIDFMPVV